MIWLFLAIVLGLALIGSPLFVIIGAATTLCFYLFLPDFGTLENLVTIVQSMEGLLNKLEFLAIPLFMVSGAIMTAGGIARRLVDVARAAFGWLPGGMAVAAVVACMYFASISGSSPVTLIAVGSIMFPALVQSKYPENFSLGLVTTAGSLGCLVPPSVSMLFYAISTGGSSAAVSPEDMFLAGLLPALFIVFLLSVYSMWVGRRVPESRVPFDFGTLRKAVRDGIWALLLPVLILGGIYGGLFTPSEAGAVAAVYALVVTIVIYREMDLKRLIGSLMESATLMGSLLPIIVLTFALNDFLVYAGVKEWLTEIIQQMNLGPFGFLLLVNIILIGIGALMDSISCTLIFAPMLAPIAWEVYGIDPLHFGIVFVVNMEIGYLMPPVATNLFVSAAVFRKPFGQVTRAVLPTLAITIVALGVIMYVPTVSKAAINWKRGVALYEPFPWDGVARPETGVAGAGPAGTPQPAAPPPSDLQALTAKSMDGWDDEPASAPAAPAAPTNMAELTAKSMEGWDDEPDAAAKPDAAGVNQPADAGANQPADAR